MSDVIDMDALASEIAGVASEAEAIEAMRAKVAEWDKRKKALAGRLVEVAKGEDAEFRVGNYVVDLQMPKPSRCVQNPRLVHQLMCEKGLENDFWSIVGVTITDAQKYLTGVDLQQVLGTRAGGTAKLHFRHVEP